MKYFFWLNFLGLYLGVFCSPIVAEPVSSKEAEKLKKALISRLELYHRDIMDIAGEEKPQEVDALKRLKKHLVEKSEWYRFIDECKNRQAFQKPSVSGEIPYLPFPYYHAKQILYKFNADLKPVVVTRDPFFKTRIIFSTNDWEIKAEYVENEILLIRFITPGIKDLFLEQLI